MDKSKLMDRFTDYDDRLLANKILDLTEYVKKNYTYKATVFLDPRQQKLVKDLLKHERDIGYRFDGGFQTSERMLCVIHHEDMEEADMESSIEILEFTWNHKMSRKPTHRDFLGSLIGSGIKREMLGDINLQEDTAYAACIREISDYILYNVERVGNTPVKVRVAEQVIQAEEQEKTMNATVASLRLDSIISAGFGLSRTKAAEIIRAGKVRVNWEENDLTSKEIRQGDVISLRGKGRIILEEIAGNTKKDRVKVTIKKFV